MQYGKTEVVVCDDTAQLGQTAARAVAGALREALRSQASVRAVFAAGESQSAFHRALAQECGIEWARVDCFNIDDFWDPRMPEAFSCGAQTVRELYGVVRPRSVNLVRFNAPAPEVECRRFESLIREAPIDLLCQGIGTSGHLALNEPDCCSFSDDRWVRLVSLVPQSKKQLMDDPNFKALGYIPEQGINMTIPAIVAARRLFTIVPLALKKPILTRLAATGTPTVSLPASILRAYPGVLFTERAACPDAWSPPGGGKSA